MIWFYSTRVTSYNLTFTCCDLGCPQKEGDLFNQSELANNLSHDYAHWLMGWDSPRQTSCIGVAGAKLDRLMMLGRSVDDDGDDDEQRHAGATVAVSITACVCECVMTRQDHSNAIWKCQQLVLSVTGASNIHLVLHWPYGHLLTVPGSNMHAPSGFIFRWVVARTNCLLISLIRVCQRKRIVGSWGKWFCVDISVKVVVESFAFGD